MLCVSLNKKQRPGQQQEVGGGKRWVYSGRTTQGSLSAASEGNNGFGITVTRPLNASSRSVTPVCQGCPGDRVKVLLWFSVISSLTKPSIQQSMSLSEHFVRNTREEFNIQHAELTVWLLSTVLLLFHRHASIQHVSSKAIWRARRRQYFKHTSFVCCDNMLCFS